MPNHRTIVEDDSFIRAVAQLGGSHQTDKALDPVIEALSLEPEAFPLVPGYEPVRLAKTHLAVRDLEIIPAIHVWFFIASDGVVHLVWAELSDPGEMSISDEPFR